MPENPVLIIGGGPAGLEAARGVADLGSVSYTHLTLPTSDLV